MEFGLRLDNKNRMSREVHVRFREGLGVQFPRATRHLAVFELAEDAQRFMRVLPLRLGKFGLRLNLPKTQLVACGKRQAWRALKAKQRLPTFDFLGFTHFWGTSRQGRVRLKRKTAKGRLRRALVAHCCQHE
jgi:hypothetical protein